MWKMRAIGLAMLLYGGIMLVLLYTPYKDWALNHSIAEVVSATDRRANNEISGSVDEPMAIAGSAVLVFAGLWFALLVPWVMNRWTRQMREQAGLGDDQPAATTPSATTPSTAAPSQGAPGAAPGLDPTDGAPG